ncbi:hypothetical protein [Arthrobacter sp. ISL-72]|uniref:hypothetical protein n=1 Tax=Arthrobacter sp. ISL-72 TaxID=2819114 RepID=UPI001BE8F9A1|nr:hypothetical protein [Arthrobacter sp. ISL-72]MBT2596666.1 hypothetical protein [Arthrobacter sp. ISL-72]
MDPLASIVLVFCAAFLWLAFALILLSRINREERRALRRARKASRVKTAHRIRPVPAAHDSMPHRHRLRLMRRHSL